jgi:hypothetical protein
MSFGGVIAGAVSAGDCAKALTEGKFEENVFA